MRVDKGYQQNYRVLSSFLSAYGIVEFWGYGSVRKRAKETASTRPYRIWGPGT